jgi:membrane protease YdiL (CAAX protease family)
MNQKITTVGYSFLLAFGFWFVSFYLNPYNFWLEMTGAVVILASTSIWLWSGYEQLTDWDPKSFAKGIVSALGLYGLFWAGNLVITSIIPFAENEISAVYGNTGAASLPVIGVLLFLVIGPGEEIFWRGTVQKRLEERYGNLFGVITGASLYALVHIWALNLTLFLAALLCGLVWGWLYSREEKLAPVIVSHSVWSVLIFLIFPV